MTQVDLNCDMGESFGVWTMGADAAVMPWVTSVNIACGFHAGDPSTMHATVASAQAAGVAIGAHIGLPDRVGFGRRQMALSAHDAYTMTIAQTGALAAMARAAGTRVTHVKPHGALYHMLEDDDDLARALAHAVRDVDPELRMVGLSGGRLLRTARELGLAVMNEAFVDRRYLATGRLVPRSVDGGVIDDTEAALAQALDLVLHGALASIDGQRLQIKADTLCIHGDRDDAAAFAEAIHRGLRAARVELRMGMPP